MVNSIIPKSRFRRFTQSGVFSAPRFNRTIEELTQELQELQAFHNDTLVPLLSGLPRGADDDEFPSIGSSIDPLSNGLSGDQIWSDDNATSTSDDILWSSTDNRKLTLKESLISLSSRVNSNFATVQDLINAVDAGVSSYSRSYIGLKAFDSTLSSDSSSMDGRISVNDLDLDQVKLDSFGSSYALDGDGNANLNYPVLQLLDALLDQHNGAAYKSGFTWGSTITLTSGTASLNDTLDVGNTTGGKDIVISGGDVISGDGYSRLQQDVEVSAAGASVDITDDVGKLFTNEGATGLATFNLPEAAAGLYYTFYNQDSDNLRVVAQTGDTIRLGSIVSADGGEIKSTAVGDSVKLVAINNIEWVVVGGFTGVWTVT
ncbi:MAG: hypothetical protein ACXABY_00295 [Candidatus Thorarchaeota archaeon]|jgi:hypothetical protein